MVEDGLEEGESEVGGFDSKSLKADEEGKDSAETTGFESGDVHDVVGGRGVEDKFPEGEKGSKEGE